MKWPAQIYGSRILIAPPTSAIRNTNRCTIISARVSLLLYICVRVGRVYLRLILCVPCGILDINYGAPLWTTFGDELSECWCDVSGFDLRRSMCRPSKIEGRCADLRKLVCRLSKIDDRCVDLRGSMIDVSTFEDQWSVCRPSKTDDRCEIMLLHLFKTLMVYLYANNCAEGLHFSAFIIIVFVTLYNYYL